MLAMLPETESKVGEKVRGTIRLFLWAFGIPFKAGLEETLKWYL